jgi:hypothetical protein
LQTRKKQDDIFIVLKEKRNLPMSRVLFFSFTKEGKNKTFYGYQELGKFITSSSSTE